MYKYACMYVCIFLSVYVFLCRFMSVCLLMLVVYITIMYIYFVCLLHTMFVGASYLLCFCNYNYCDFFFHFIALPVPVVTITLEGAPVIGESFSIICNAAIKDNLSPNINLAWIYNWSLNNDITITSDSDGSLTLNVDPVQESHEALYTCVAMVTIPDIPQQIIRNATYDFLTLGQFLFYKNKL